MRHLTLVNDMIDVDMAQKILNETPLEWLLSIRPRHKIIETLAELFETNLETVETAVDFVDGNFFDEVQ